MTPYNKHILTLIAVLIFISLKINAQEVNVIDKKGTIINVKNTRVYTGTKPADADAVIGDMYFDVYPSPTSIEIWDGTIWKVINDNTSHTGTAGSVFFAGATGSPDENNAQLTWDNAPTALKLYVGTPINTGTSNKLTVNGTARAVRFRSSDGTVGNPAFKFQSDNNTGMYRNGVDQLGFSTAGINALSIDAAQNISIPQNLSVTGTYADTSGDTGTTGQILSSIGAGAGTNWVNNAAVTPGDIKHGIQTASHSGWYLLNGTSIASLPANAQTNAASLGLAGNLPDARNRVLKHPSISGEVIGDIVGAATTTLDATNIPELTGTTTTSGDHDHDTNDITNVTERIYHFLNSNRTYATSSGTTPTGGTGSHNHNVTVNSGVATPISLYQPSLVVNTFIYLGL